MHAQASDGSCMWVCRPITIRWMALEWRVCVWNPRLSPCSFCLCTFIFLLCSRRNFLSRAAQGRLGVDPRPWRKSHSEKKLSFCSAGGCCPWHQLHSPTVWPCCVLFPPWATVCDVAYVCVCVVKLEIYFVPAPPKLCNLEALIPQHRDCLHFLLSEHLSSHWQSIVCDTDVLFVYRGS